MAKSSSKKKGAAKKKSATKAKSSPQAKKPKAKGTADAKATAAKTPPKKGKKKETTKDLLLRKFDTWQPDAPYAPPEEKVDVPAAPPIADGENADRVKALLLKQFGAGPASPGKTPAPRKKSAPAQAKTTAKASAEKAAAPPKKAAKAPPPAKEPVSTRELLSRRFDTWVPEKRYAPPPEKVEEPTAPPIAAGADADRVKQLLLKKIDLSGPAEAPVQPSKTETPEPAKESPKEPVSIGELLHRQFDSWRPDTFYVPPKTVDETPAAPPIAVGEDAERVRGLLFRQFDRSDVAVPAADTAPSAGPEKPVVPEAKTEVPEEVKAPEAVKAQEAREETAPEAEPDQAVPKSPTEVPEEVKAADAVKAQEAGAGAEPAQAVPKAATEVPEEEKVTGEVATEEAKADTAPGTEPAQAVPKAATEVPEEEKVTGEVATEEAKADTAPGTEPAQAVPKAATEVPEEEKVTGEVATEEARAETMATETEQIRSSPIRPEPVYRPEVGWEAQMPAAEETSGAGVTPTPPQQKGSDPMERSMTFLAAIAIVLFALIIGTSFSNASKYYLRSTDDGLEIWKGSFAPMGDERVLRMEGMAAPASLEGVYAEEQVMPLAFDYYMDKADEAFYAEGISDYEEVEAYIEKALVYADARNAKRAFAMQKNMRILRLITRADIEASRATPAGYRKAIEYLEQAKKLDSTDLIEMNRTRNAPIIEKKLAAYQELLSEASTAPAPETETPTIEAAETD